MNDDVKFMRLFSFMMRELVAGANKKSVSKFTEEMKKLNFTITDFIPGSKEISATDTSPRIDAVRQTMKMIMSDEIKFGKLIAGEAHKFFLASMVSLDRSRQSQEHNIAWQIVEHYYAAYYAVHYLMRLAGYSLTNIDDATLKIIKTSAIMDIKSANGGLSTVEFSQDCKEIVIRKNGKGGGSHKEVWAIWIKILDVIIGAAQEDDHEYSSLEIKLQEHKRFIRISEEKFSPSDIRAEVNYQFKGDTWCFMDADNPRITKIKQHIDSDAYTLDASQDKVIRLINNNKLIISLARSAFTYSIKNYARGICRSINSQYKERICTLP